MSNEMSFLPSELNASRLATASLIETRNSSFKIHRIPVPDTARMPEIRHIDIYEIGLVSGLGDSGLIIAFDTVSGKKVDNLATLGQDETPKRRAELRAFFARSAMEAGLCGNSRKSEALLQATQAPALANAF